MRFLVAKIIIYVYFLANR